MTTDQKKKQLEAIETVKTMISETLSQIEYLAFCEIECKLIQIRKLKS